MATASGAVPDAKADRVPVRSRRPKQLRLFELANPMSARVGEDVFRKLPSCAGVYFFYESTGRLLYIGQSGNLRARVGSYRHVCPERHPRRILRLVHRIARIEWQTCDTAEEAIELERMLLLEKRPPFNRAGTWQPPPWYLRISTTVDELRLSLTRTPKESGDAMQDNATWALLPSQERRARVSTGEGPARDGPDRVVLPPGMFSVSRGMHATVVRCLLRLSLPDLPLSLYPGGVLNMTAPVEMGLLFEGRAQSLGRHLEDYLLGNTAPLLEVLGVLEAEEATAGKEAEQAPAMTGEASYWREQMEGLRAYARKMARIKRAGTR